jgi:hypothetical protein
MMMLRGWLKYGALDTSSETSGDLQSLSENSTVVRHGHQVLSAPHLIPNQHLPVVSDTEEGGGAVVSHCNLRLSIAALTEKPAGRHCKAGAQQQQQPQPPAEHRPAGRLVHQLGLALVDGVKLCHRTVDGQVVDLRAPVLDTCWHAACTAARQHAPPHTARHTPRPAPHRTAQRCFDHWDRAALTACWLPARSR